MATQGNRFAGCHGHLVLFLALFQMEMYRIAVNLKETLLAILFIDIATLINAS